MKRLIWLGLAMISLLAACVAPATPAKPKGALPEVTVFRSPT
ncbi:MAG: hypothetical protein WAZ19_17025 [Anaerolineae bacterium]